MDNVRIELNPEGIREELLRSQWAMDCCQEAADQVARKAGYGFETSQHVGKNRVNVSVGAETIEAYKDNMESNALLRALG